MSKSSESHEYVSVKLMGGGQVVAAAENVVGYCHFAEHRGAITKTILKKRDCAKKGCHYFERYKDNSYWIAYDQMQETHQPKKESRKRMQQEKEKQQTQWKEIAQGIADDLEYDIDVIHAGRQRMRSFHAEIYGVAADAAVGLGCVDLLFVGFKLRTLGAVVIGSHVRAEAACRSGSGLWHGTLLSGHEKSTLFQSACA